VENFSFLFSLFSPGNKNENKLDRDRGRHGLDADGVSSSKTR
jgi:hypothetical protein